MQWHSAGQEDDVRDTVFSKMLVEVKLVLSGNDKNSF